MIGIIAAMDEEVRVIKETMKHYVKESRANCIFYKGHLFNKQVVLVKSGIGKVNAALATTLLHEKYDPDIIINTGSAGGYSDSLNVGDVVVSKNVVHHDVDARAFDYVYGQVPGMPAFYEADPNLIKLTKQVLEKLNISHATGLIGSGDSFMDDPDNIQYILKQFPNLIAVEMEAAAVAQICFQYETPFIIIRALSDIAGKQSTMSFEQFLELAVTNSSAIVIELIKYFEP